MAFDDVNIFFSASEKKAFLTKHGYAIEHIHGEEDVCIHGSCFVNVPFTKDVATKEGEQHDIDDLFLKILKQKLLEL